MERNKELIPTTELSISHGVFEQYHEEILEIINDLELEAEKDPYSDLFEKQLSKLTHYCFQYFNEEERFMQKLQYPKIAEHKKSYQEYAEKIVKFNVNYSKTKEPITIVNYLKDWWINHITTMSSDYKNYTNTLSIN